MGMVGSVRLSILIALFFGIYCAELSQAEQDALWKQAMQQVEQKRADDARRKAEDAEAIRTRPQREAEERARVMAAGHQEGEHVEPAMEPPSEAVAPVVAASPPPPVWRPPIDRDEYEQSNSGADFAKFIVAVGGFGLICLFSVMPAIIANLCGSRQTRTCVFLIFPTLIATGVGMYKGDPFPPLAIGLACLLWSASLIIGTLTGKSAHDSQ